MAIELRKQPNPAKLLFTALRPQASRKPASSGAPIGDVRLREHRQDPERFRAYQELCGFRASDVVPPTWLHVLTFPLQTHIMAGKDWPFSSMGAVHVANSMKTLRPVYIHEVLDLEVRVSHVNPHAKGTVFELIGNVRVGSELVWTSRSTYLVRGHKFPGRPVEVPREELPEGTPSESWSLDADLGRKYAKVSGDYNPIHLHPLTAKVFGFPSTIAHGMWTHARALAALGDRLPERYETRVQFTKPIPLPSTVKFIASDTHYGVVGEDGKPRLVGSYWPIDADPLGLPLDE